MDNGQSSVPPGHRGSSRTKGWKKSGGAFFALAAADWTAGYRESTLGATSQLA